MILIILIIVTCPNRELYFCKWNYNLRIIPFIKDTPLWTWGVMRRGSEKSETCLGLKFSGIPILPPRWALDLLQCVKTQTLLFDFFFIFGKLTVLQRVKSHQVQVLKHGGVAKKEKPVFNGLWDSTAWHAQQSQVKAEVHFDSVNVGVEFTVHNPHELKKYIYTGIWQGCSRFCASSDVLSLGLDTVDSST